MPYISEAVYQRLYGQTGLKTSIHGSAWPQADKNLINGPAEEAGEAAVEIAGAARRHKSETHQPMGTPLEKMRILTGDPGLLKLLRECETDLKSVTRAKTIEIIEKNGSPRLTVTDIQ